MQIEYSGQKFVDGLIFELRRLKANKVLLVTGKESFELSGAKEILTKVLAEYDVYEFNGFSVNPKYSEVLQGAETCSENDCDVIIAVGGGSCIDVAKSLNAIQGNLDLALDIVTGMHAVKEKLLPLIAVPTTAGTGSEATHFSVIYVDGKKYSLASKYLLPDVVILNASFTYTLPNYIAACTGFDALCQAIESIWAKGANETSQKFAFKAVELLLCNLPLSVNDRNVDAKEKVMLAANLAGKAINISKTTAPHALSYSITSLFGIPHGHAVAMTLGRFFSYHETRYKGPLDQLNSDKKIKQLSERIYGLLGVSSGLEAEAFWYDFMDQCGLGLNVDSSSLSMSNKLNQVVDSVNVERLSNHPIELTREDLLYIIKTIPEVGGE